MILNFHPIGNVFFKNLASAMADQGILGELHTAFQFSKDSPLRYVLPQSLYNTLQRRSLPPNTIPFAHYRPMREALRLLSIRAGWKSLNRHEHGRFSVDSVFRDFDLHIAKRLEKTTDIRGVYAYEDGAAHSFKAAKERGISTNYDLPIGYWKAARELLKEEAELEPEWASTLHGNSDSKEKTDRKDKELHLADKIFVASTFTKETLKLANPLPGEIHTVPYGAPSAIAEKTDILKRPTNCLKILYVGSLGQRKGLSYLKKAIGDLETPFELTIIGAKPQQPCRPLDELLSQHRYIPSCPHADVLKEMQNHHVFLFPSLFEGFGLVLLEAMSQGMAVMTTENTAGPDIIEDGKDGFIIPIRNPEAITNRLTELSEDFDKLTSIGLAAQNKAKTFTWEAYGKRICHILMPQLSKD